MPSAPAIKAVVPAAFQATSKNSTRVSIEVSRDVPVLLPVTIDRPRLPDEERLGPVGSPGDGPDMTQPRKWDGAERVLGAIVLIDDTPPSCGKGTIPLGAPLHDIKREAVVRNGHRTHGGSVVESRERLPINIAHDEREAIYAPIHIRQIGVAPLDPLKYGELPPRELRQDPHSIGIPDHEGLGVSRSKGDVTQPQLGGPRQKGDEPSDRHQNREDDHCGGHLPSRTPLARR